MFELFLRYSVARTYDVTLSIILACAPLKDLDPAMCVLNITIL